MKSLIAISLLLSSTTFANQADIDTIEQASSTLNNAVLNQVITENQGYIKALAYYRLAITQNIKVNQPAAIHSLNLAIAELEAVIAQNNNDVEALALLSQCYGFRISFDPLQAATLGPKSMTAITKAYQLNPDNPRVMLFKGIMSFNTPENYGGSKAEAIKSLNRAIVLFADDKNSGNYWGEAEAYVWRGLSYQALNENDKATADFENALLVSPNFGWAKMLLGKI